MQKKKRKNHTRDRKELFVDEKPEHRAAQRESRCICLQPTFHIPFPIQLLDVLSQNSSGLPCRTSYPPLRCTIGALVSSHGAVSPHSIFPRSYDHHKIPSNISLHHDSTGVLHLIYSICRAFDAVPENRVVDLAGGF